MSYLLGRYSPIEESKTNNLSASLLKPFLAAISVVAVFVGHSWVYQIVDAQTRFRGFLGPLVGTVYILSCIGQQIGSRAVAKKRKWILCGSDEEKEMIYKEIEGSNLRCRIVIAEEGREESEVNALKEADTGIVVGRMGLKDEEMVERLLRSREEGRRIVPLLNWCEQELQRIPPELVNTEWLVEAEGFGLRPGSISWRVKRLADLSGAIVLIALTVPIVLVVCFLIWAEDRGPILYRQIRTGHYGREIEIWKLRSMRVNAESDGAQWSRKGDPRVTRIGKIIRATRIDELPQLINVVRGELSLIGPRPERPEIECELEKSIPHYRIRHWIRPGLSGWAQVCHPYGASLEDSRVKLSYDLYYIRNAGLMLDALITMNTIRLVVGAKGSNPKE